MELTITDLVLLPSFTTQNKHGALRDSRNCSLIILDECWHASTVANLQTEESLWVCKMYLHANMHSVSADQSIKTPWKIYESSISQGPAYMKTPLQKQAWVETHTDCWPSLWTHTSRVPAYIHFKSCLNSTFFILFQTNLFMLHYF